MNTFVQLMEQLKIILGLTSESSLLNLFFDVFSGFLMIAIISCFFIVPFVLVKKIFER